MTEQTFLFIKDDGASIRDLLKEGWHIVSVTAQHVAVSTYSVAILPVHTVTERGPLFIVFEREKIDGVIHDPPA